MFLICVFLAVQDSSIGDIVSQWVSEVTFDFSDRAEQSTAEQSTADSDLDLGLG